MTALNHPRTGSFARSTDGSDDSEAPRVALYEHAAGLLAVAGALQAAAHEPDGAAALSPTLACLGASLEALAGAAGQLGVHAVEHLSDAGSSPVDARGARAEVRQRFESVVDALQRARIECTHALAAVSPMRCCVRGTGWDGL